MSNPIQDIEDKQAQVDMGVMLSRVFEGAFQETQSFRRAFWVTVAYFCAMLKSAQNNPEEDNDGT